MSGKTLINYTNMMENVYPCFQIDMKTSQAAQSIKSRALTKVIDSILDIESFYQKCVVVKGSLQ